MGFWLCEFGRGLFLQVWWWILVVWVWWDCFGYVSLGGVLVVILSVWFWWWFWLREFDCDFGYTILVCGFWLCECHKSLVMGFGCSNLMGDFGCESLIVIFDCTSLVKVLVARIWRCVFGCVSLLGEGFVWHKFGGEFWLCESDVILFWLREFGWGFDDCASLIVILVARFWRWV